MCYTAGSLQGGSIGSSEVSFTPGRLQEGHFRADTQTAGAVCLLAQTALPCALFAPGPLTLNLRGGTNADMAPQIDEYTEIFLPNIARYLRCTQRSLRIFHCISLLLGSGSSLSTRL